MSHPNTPHDNPILEVWHTQLQHASQNVWLMQLLLKQWQRVLKRLAYFYAQLASLPRRNRRALQRALATSLIGAAMLLALSSAPVALANAITVDPGASGIGGGDGCSLVEAIINANDDAATYAECVGGSGADTITLPSSATLDYLTAYSGISALPYVTTEIEIEANNSTISRNLSAPDPFNIFVVYGSGGELTLNDATLTGGYAPIYFGGGAILNYEGSLELRNCTISGNAAFLGGGVSSFAATTTGIYDSTISENRAYYGGGVVNAYGLTIISDSTIRDNVAYLGGGGVAQVQGITTLNRTTVSGNISRFGGGILHLYMYGDMTANAYVNLNSSTVTDNYAYADGGGIFSGEIPAILPIPPPIADGGASPNAPRAGGVFAKLKQLRQAPGGEIDLNDPSLRVDLSALKTSRVSGDKKLYRRTHANKQTAPRRKDSAKQDAPRRERKFPAIESMSSPGALAADFYAVTYINQSTIDNNTAYDNGGGISNNYGGLTALFNSTVSHNTATYGGGGGIDAYDGIVGLANVTMTANDAADNYGGGIELDNGELILGRTLISGNLAALGGNEIAVHGGIYFADNYNLFGHEGEIPTDAFYNFTPGPADFDATFGGSYAAPLANILDTTLALNSNPNGTLTNALILGSPALDKAPTIDCSDYPTNDVDERDFPRNVDINNNPSLNECDIGAFELQNATAVNVTGLRAKINDAGNVALKWRTTTETQIAGFNVWRRNGDAEWKQINANLKQAKHSGGAQGDKYRYVDKKAKDGNTYRYKIEVKYLDGSSQFTDVVKVTTP